jgi:hypothetical protein
VPRDDAIELRSAHDDELDEVAALLADRGDDADAVDLRLVAADPDEGVGSVLVAVDPSLPQGRRVVSTATLLRETVRASGVALPAAQVEMVATAPSHEGRGLVRDLMALAHRRSADRGDVLQVMIGIPFFYRQFGYAYSMRIPDTRVLDIVPSPDPSVVVRPAALDDVAAMQELQDAEQAAVAVSMPHSPGCWRWLCARDGSAQWVATHDGRVIATARATPPDEGVVLGEIAGSRAGVEAIVAHAHRLASEHGPGDATVLAMDRPGTPVHDLVGPLLAPVDPADAGHWFYARIERPAPALERLRPVLSARWAEAGLGEQEVLLSSYRSHVRFRIGPDGMGPVAEGGPLQAPVSAGGSGVPPDVLAPLLLGPHGAVGLERLHPDVLLGRQREAMAVLFPPVLADLLTFYLPV